MQGGEDVSERKELRIAVFGGRGMKMVVGFCLGLLAEYVVLS